MRQVITTLMDALGGLFVVAALGVLAYGLTIDGWVRALATVGAGLLILSWVVDGAPMKRKGRR